ncbi:hypothetical protein SAMN06298215_0112 [Bacteroidales bacterium WCE2008]|nr:hypothetical protein SAMN06298215_0112 [Bacteroidales bacterium WCE2008]
MKSILGGTSCLPHWFFIPKCGFSHLQFLRGRVLSYNYSDALKLYPQKGILSVYINENIKPVTVLKHGRRAVSLSKYRLDYNSQCLVNLTNRYRIDVF